MFVGFICRFLAHFETIILGRGIGWNVWLEGTLSQKGSVPKGLGAIDEGKKGKTNVA